MPQKCQHLRHNSSKDTGPRQKTGGGTEIPTNLKDNDLVSHCKCLTYSHVILPTRFFQRQSHYRMDSWAKGGSNYRFQSTFDNQKILIKTIWASKILWIHNRILPPVWDWKSGTHTENSGRLRANRSRTRAVDFDYAKTANNTTSSRLNTIRTTKFSCRDWPPISRSVHKLPATASARNKKTLTSLILTAPKPKLISIGFSQRVWKLIPAKALTKKDCEFVHISKHKWRSWDIQVVISRRSSTMRSCFDKHVKCSANSELGQGKLVLCTLWGSQRNDYLHSYIKGHSLCQNQSNFIFLKRDTVEWERTHSHWGRALPTINLILGNGLWAGGLSPRSTRQACFFSPPNPQDSSSRQRTITWTVPVHAPRIVLCKQNYRPDHDFFCTIYHELKTQIWCFITVAVTRFFYESSMPASALDKEVTFAGAVSLERKRLDFEKPEATPGDRIDSRISGRPEEPYLLNERQAEVVLMSSLMKQVYKQIDRIIHRRMQNKSITTLYHIEIQNFMHYKTVTWNVVNEDRRLCSMPNLHQTSKTRRDILYLCILHTKDFRGGQEASRTTDQQSIHHVRLWNSQFRV